MLLHGFIVLNLFSSNQPLMLVTSRRTLASPIYQRSLSPFTAFPSEEAIGMSGYEVYNHSDLTLRAQALVISEANSSALG
jgi:hypothetical protein